MKTFLLVSALIGGFIVCIAILQLTEPRTDISDVVDSLTFYAVLFAVIEVVLAIAIFLMKPLGNDSGMAQLSRHRDDIDNYLANKHHFTLRGHTFYKEVNGVQYSYQYDIREKRELFRRYYYIVSKYRIYDVLRDERLMKLLQYDSSDFIDSALFNQEGLLFGDKLEDIIDMIEFHITGFEITLLAALESLKDPVTFSGENLIKTNCKESTVSSVLQDMSDGKYGKIAITIMLVLSLISSIIWIASHYVEAISYQDKISYLVFVLMGTMFLFPLVIRLRRPSYILTKIFGLREEKDEKFYGRFSNHVPFCIAPYKYKTFFHTEKINIIYHSRHRHRGKDPTLESHNMSLSFKLEELTNNDVIKLEKELKSISFQYDGEEICFQIEDKNGASMEDMLRELFKCAAFVFNISEDEILSKEEKNKKYHVKAMLYNFTHRLKDKLWVVGYVILIIYFEQFIQFILK